MVEVWVGGVIVEIVLLLQELLAVVGEGVSGSQSPSVAEDATRTKLLLLDKKREKKILRKSMNCDNVFLIFK